MMMAQSTVDMEKYVGLPQLYSLSHINRTLV